MMTFDQPYTILVDMDGVLGWWEKRFISEMSKRHPHIKLWEFGVRTEADQPEVNKLFDLPEVQDVLRTPGLYLSLDPIEYALQGLNEMVAAGLNVFICTSPALRNVTCASDKYEWVKLHFGKEWAARVIITKDKTLVRGDILVDDKAYVTGAMEPEWIHVRFDQSYNRGDMTRPRMLGWKNWRPAVESALELRRAA